MNNEHTLQTWYHKSARLGRFGLKMHPKSFVFRAPPRHAGAAYSTCADILARFKGAYF